MVWRSSWRALSPTLSTLRSLSTATTGRISWSVVTPRDLNPNAKPVLLVHGFACGKLDWGALPRMLAARSRRPVIIFDNRGVGESEAPAVPYSIDEMAADALGVADAAGATQFGVLGISMGGLIAQSLALSHPERVSALVLGCTSHGGREAKPNPPEFIQTCIAWANESSPNESSGIDAFMRFSLPRDGGDAPRADPTLLASFKASFLATRRTSAGLQGQLGAMMKFNSTERLGEICCPTLVIAGDRDAALPIENSESLARRIAGAELVLWEGAGHFWWAHRTVEAVQVLAEALARGDKQSSTTMTSRL